MHTHMYVGSFTEEFGWLTSPPGSGIGHYLFDDSTGAIEHVGTTEGLVSPHCIAVHPWLPVLYALEFSAPGRVTSFAIRPNGELERQGTTSSFGDDPVAISVHPSGERAYVANWTSATLGLLDIDKSGQAGFGGLVADPVADLVGQVGTTIFVHQFRSSPGGSVVLATYFGLDEVVAYVADEHGTLGPEAHGRISFPPGSAPRHVAYHPSGKVVYVVGEKDAMVYVLAAEDCMPTKIVRAVPAFSSEFQGPSTPSELTLDASGNILYVANRGSDSITVFGVDESGGIELRGGQASVGSGPRDITVDPSGRFLAAANCDSGDVVMFGIDADSSLNPVGEPIPAASASAIVFVREQLLTG